MEDEEGSSYVRRTLDYWMLVGTLERLAEASKRVSDEDDDHSGKAYKAGKADGLMMASQLLKETMGPTQLPLHPNSKSQIPNSKP